MRLRYKPWAKDYIAEHPEYVVSDPKQWRGKWGDRFEKEQPIHIEVGMGKGKFLVEMAQKNPTINFIGVEIQESIIVLALEKVIAEKLPNIQLLHLNGSDLKEDFEPGEVDRIYLNFSDPWPKKRHTKRRLTYKTFLETYKDILSPDGYLQLKTDNQGLFEYSLVSLSEFKATLMDVSLDLHALNDPDNVTTEYEEKFSAKGNRIYRLRASIH